MGDYERFLNEKRHSGAPEGIAAGDLPKCLFGFQADLVAWALRLGRAAIFADCGLGKTIMQLAWSDAVTRHTGKRVLVLTPLAVGAQTIAEAARFGIEADRSRHGEPVAARIVVTNYEQLAHFSPVDFSGVVCDESSILKSFDGARKDQVTQFMRKVPFRLLATATAAPNDYIELGTSSEALGGLGSMDMLGRFFASDQNSTGLRRQYGESPKWRFKGHAESPFWRWVVSWARAIRRPSDLGFPDVGFSLPPLTEREHVVRAKHPAPGHLFELPASDLRAQREERRRTLVERCEAAAALVSHGEPAVVWCHGNDEGDLLEELIPGSVQVAGVDSDDTKESRFASFRAGESRVLITKPKIGGFGLNWQHCAHIVYFPSHSYESYYQAVRRCWRFGQKSPVTVDLVLTEGDRLVMANLRRKANQASAMFSSLVEEMKNACAVKPRRASSGSVEVPSWIR